MSRPLPGADYRGFYAALGIELPGWAHTEAPVRCFADPDAHAHGDRNASCSINVHSGLFNCHGCAGARHVRRWTSWSPTAWRSGARGATRRG